MRISTLFTAEHTKKTSGLCAKRERGNPSVAFGQFIVLIWSHRLNKIHLAKLALFVLHVTVKLRRDKHVTGVSQMELDLTPWMPLVRRQYSNVRPVDQRRTPERRQRVTEPQNQETRDKEGRAHAQCTYNA